MKHARPTVLYAAAVRDAAGVNASPGAVLVQHGKVVATGEPGSLPGELVEQAEVIERPNHLVLPAMVNAHTHLELTDIGPQPYDPTAGFVGWALMLRTHWPEDLGQGVLPDDAWFVEAACRGIAGMRDAGVQAAGDISRFERVMRTRQASGIDGETYFEIFGLGSPFNEYGLEVIARGEKAIQPHAPYSAGPALFQAASSSGQPVCCHLAETLDEHAFVAQLEGPFFDFIRSIKKWDNAFAQHYGTGQSPVQWMRPYLETAANDGGWLVAHCNYVSDEDIAILADTKTSVAYCPIASEYFGHKDHRYRDMLAAGVNVCLGTDSIVGTDPNDPQPLGLLSAMRRLYRRDETDSKTLLAMATINGARALRLKDSFATLQPGAPARFACLPIAVESEADPLIQVLSGQDPVEAISLET